jgi:hypothetical protein
LAFQLLHILLFIVLFKCSYGVAVNGEEDEIFLKTRFDNDFDLVYRASEIINNDFQDKEIHTIKVDKNGDEWIVTVWFRGQSIWFGYGELMKCAVRNEDERHRVEWHCEIKDKSFFKHTHFLVPKNLVAGALRLFLGRSNVDVVTGILNKLIQQSK